MKIYTRRGDGGETALFGAGRVDKASVRIEALGSVDELNATIGWALAQDVGEPARSRLASVQHDLFAIGAELASPSGADADQSGPRVPVSRIEELEGWIDEATGQLPELTVFVLPGGAPAAAALHLARTVCRRAERAVVRLAGGEGLGPVPIPYLNRLSDLLFTLARSENHRAGTGDVEWRKG